MEVTRDGRLVWEIPFEMEGWSVNENHQIRNSDRQNGSTVVLRRRNCEPRMTATGHQLPLRAGAECFRFTPMSGFGSS